ncbi:protein LAZY 1 [Herrania umbratica]|uniref:Protein LAZY 1 n=1 Tax=Herrania umbratica TaxID=108875 RepID=A0A6J1BM34_9ROSI|nr:protein LAZY 1 [Herrania umbratica]
MLMHQSQQPCLIGTFLDPKVIHAAGKHLRGNLPLLKRMSLSCPHQVRLHDKNHQSWTLLATTGLLLASSDDAKILDVLLFNNPISSFKSHSPCSSKSISIHASYENQSILTPSSSKREQNEAHLLLLLLQLLGWMLHKLRQSNIEPFKDFTIGNYCTCLSAHSSLNDQDSNPKSASGHGHGSRFSTLSQQGSENSFTEFEAKGVEENFGDEASTVISGLFNGFLTIGTLGSELIISEPETPTFAMSLENSEEKAEVTENDLKIINDELEKFLEAEAEEHGSNESSGRNSQVSTITLSGKPMQEANAKEYGKTIVCPLQGYLFGSSIELPEARFEVKKEKASLAELFYRAKIAEESPTEKCGKEEMQTKQTNKPVKHLIKKILKKLHASSGSSTSKETNSVSTKKKLHKVIKLFHRKIHPESSIAERQSKNLHTDKMNNAPYDDGEYTDGQQVQQGKGHRRLPQGSWSKEGTQNYKTISKLPQYGLTGFTAGANGEHWIKTDADYLVLEL